MFGSAVLDVAIALALVYFTFSLLCSALNEAICRAFDLRARTLIKGVRALLPADWQERIYRHRLIKALAPEGKNPTHIPPWSFALALLDEATQAADGVPERRELKADLPESVRKPLETILNTVSGEVTTLRCGIETWFDATMDRATEWYRKVSQYIVLAVAAVATVAMNVDTVTIVEAIARDSTLRATLVAAAEKAAAPPAPGRDQAGLADLRTQLETTRLPIGWYQENVPDDLSGWPGKIAGWLVSAAAISLGAPFWYDVIKRLVGLRSAAKGKEKAA